MKPEVGAELVLAVTRSKAKMFEYNVPLEDHIEVAKDPIDLLDLVVSLLGDLAASTNALTEPAAVDGQEDLRFAAYFLDSYVKTRIRELLDPYMVLLGSASYYLADLPGSSKVMADALGDGDLELGANGLERLLCWLVRGDLDRDVEIGDVSFAFEIENVVDATRTYFSTGTDAESLFLWIDTLRDNAYSDGTGRELLFADAIAAIARRRYWNSSWYCLPKYSEIESDFWRPTLQKPGFLRELWPAQRLLGENGVLAGASAIVQMPTSAGKTRASELVIRSAFLSGRTELAVIVAPFRALCHEIRDGLGAAFEGDGVSVDELSDVAQADFDVGDYLARKQVLVVTPEKLMYVLRHSPELAVGIGLLIYDEGHQFDSGSRGVTYELLLTSLKAMVAPGTQVVLISAVISNAESVSGWLNGESGKVVAGSELVPTYRTIGFASWTDARGRIEFIKPNSPDEREFFVPRVIEQIELPRKKGQRKTTVHMFPARDDGNTVALYLGMKLVGNGSIAIFCGTKNTASSICEMLVDLAGRKTPVTMPSTACDPGELERLYQLYVKNVGADAMSAQAARLGAFAHHGSTPHGIRLAVEHAMKVGEIAFVVCTSTLAQGVNLPIRYLILTGVYQGTERLKVRDFHNLIGRVGRSGMHTEGSVLFADPELYDKRKGERMERWRWSKIKELLHPKLSEPCASMLLSLFEVIQNDKRTAHVISKPLDFVRNYVDDPDTAEKWISDIVEQHGATGYSEANVRKQVLKKQSVVTAIESFLMAHWDDVEAWGHSGGISSLVEGTLAYHLANDEEKTQLVEVFKLLADNIERLVDEPEKRKAFGKTMFGVADSKAIEAWTEANIDEITSVDSYENLFVALWPALERFVRTRAFAKATSRDAIFEAAGKWFQGKSFEEIFSDLKRDKVKVGPRYFTMESTVDLCENAIGYEGTLIIGAVSVVVESLRPSDDRIGSVLKIFQKRLKYGLESTTAVSVYELGFADRPLAKELATLIGVARSRKRASEAIGLKHASVAELLESYPSYFRKRLETL